MSNEIHSNWQNICVDKANGIVFNIPCKVYKGGFKMFSFFKKTPSMSTSELATKVNSNITLLDVRTPQEYRAGHISKAQNVPLDKIANYQGKNKDVVVICQSGMRSRQAAKILTKKGYQVTNVRGGMSQWSGRTVGGK